MEIKININKNEKFSFLYIITGFQHILKKYTLTEAEELMEIYESGEDVIFTINDNSLTERIKNDLIKMGVKFHLSDGESEVFFNPKKSELWDFIEKYERNKNE
ncbi:hypothetical protein [uncultured Dokdonia sp.]|uniref:hypothetical protein n=1 Tax=uncultured Dokdonia sp. TaxID=575653 RepID=UPI002626BC93|nr:hypothetical protein [uncultured Dokdonia sp.]